MHLSPFTATLAFAGFVVALPVVATAGSDCTPPAATAKEVEGCGQHTNGGCNTLAHLTEPIAFGEPVAGSFWGDAAHRDTDFYRFAISQPSVIRARAWSLTFTQLALVDTCAVVSSDAGTCALAEACLPPGVYEVFVSPLDAYPGCGTEESAYTLQLDVVTDAGPCTPLAGDLDRDGVVGGFDLNMLLSAWGSTNPGSADLNGDETVDGRDLGLLLGSWTS